MGTRVHENTPQVRQTMYGLRDELSAYQVGDCFLSVEEVEAQYAVCGEVAKCALRMLVKARLLGMSPGERYRVIGQSQGSGC